MSKNSPEGTARQKEMMLKALEANYGNVRAAAKLAGISSQTHYNWRKQDLEYEAKTDSMRDVCYRDIKENLISKGLKQIEKGNASVLIKMLSIFLKDLPDEMKILSKCNNVPLKVRIKYVDTP